MTTIAKPNIAHTLQSILYDRALHPGLFDLKSRRVVTHGGYEVEAWLMTGQHVLRFQHNDRCVSELVTEQESNLPAAGLTDACFCAGENELEHRFEGHKITYMTNVQTEQLPLNIYQATMQELIELAEDSGALMHCWQDDVGTCVGIIDIETCCREVRVQCFHMIADGGIVIRTQTIFEHD